MTPGYRRRNTRGHGGMFYSGSDNTESVMSAEPSEAAPTYLPAPEDMTDPTQSKGFLEEMKSTMATLVDPNQDISKGECYFGHYARLLCPRFCTAVRLNWKIVFAPSKFDAPKGNLM